MLIKEALCGRNGSRDYCFISNHVNSGCGLKGCWVAAQLSLEKRAAQLTEIQKRTSANGTDDVIVHMN
jgi:hypothetical protein